MRIWNEGMSIVGRVYELTKDFPKAEEFGLKAQIRRAAVSIPSNIAEGCSRTSQREFRYFLEVSLGSAFELETQLILATSLCFIQKDDLDSLLASLRILQKRINALIGKVDQFQRPTAKAQEPL